MAQAGSNGKKLIYIESVTQIRPGGTFRFGPSGPNCAPTTGGTGCAFITGNITVTSQTNPLGPSTGAVTFTELFGFNGKFVTPSGPHDASGNPTGFCAPEFGTETDTYQDGSTITENFQSTDCCAGPKCLASGQPLGPPEVIHSADVITGGTGRFANAAGALSGSVGHAEGGVPGIFHLEGVLELPADSN
jgi:hypothetical protein